MKKLSLLTAAVALTAVGAHADWILSDYATVAADSAAVNKFYGAQTFGNPASGTTLTAGAGSIVFGAKLASDASEGYTANVGLLHPLTPDWAETDLTGLKGVTFEYKNSAKITDALAFSFGSGAYTDAIAKAGTVYENTVTGAAALGVNTSWRTATMDIIDFAPPKWWTPTAGFPSIDTVLKKVKNVQFAPKTAYTLDGTQAGVKCTKCVGPDMTAITLELRNITLKGINASNWPNPLGLGCTGAAITKIDDFMDADMENELGGYWYTFSDSGSAAVAKDMADKAKGSSSATAVPDAGGFIAVTASLNKTLGTTWHDYAGWASLGLGFAGEGGLEPVEAAKITAISFLIMGQTIDANVKTINFKASMTGVSDTALHMAKLPVADMSVEGGKVACIRPEDLKQESFVAPTHKVAFDPAKMIKMAWEAKITDQKSTAINLASAKFLVSDVKVYGSANVTSGTRNRQSKISGFSVRSSEGVLSLSGYQGIQSFDVVSLDGKKITSFAPAATVALSLPRGSYFLVGKRDGASLTKSFAVVR